MVGFLPIDDPRIMGTVDAIQKHLTKDGLVRRYIPAKSPDGLKGGEGTFLPCSFWLVVCLHLLGRKDEANGNASERLLALRNDIWVCLARSTIQFKNACWGISLRH